MAILTNVKYESNLVLPGDTDEVISVVRCSPAATALTVGDYTNTPPSGDVNSSDIIRISGTRKLGITARHLVIYRIAGTAPTQFREYRRVPIFQVSNFNAILSNPPGTITYQSLDDWILVGGLHERYHLFFSGASA